MTLSDADILVRVRARLGDTPPARIGVAVSGGGDSVALMHILSRCFDAGTVQLHVATVDHGLRSEAAVEARAVAQLAGQMGLPHSTLHWTGWNHSGNLQDQARKARYRLLREWAEPLNLDMVALGHTADDQAETVLMRLARASGVDGLAAMPMQCTLFGLKVIRPLLDLTRQDLRDYLTGHDIGWAEDPSNEDTRFDRVRARAALALLEPLGLTAQALVDVAGNMADARAALDHATHRAACELMQIDGGDIVLDAHGVRELPTEIARRLLVGAICWIGGAQHPPRRAPVLDALAAIRAGRGMTLAGCRLLCGGSTIRLCREYAAVRDLRVPARHCWDRRWRLIGEPEPESCLAALGPKGLAQCPDWRAAGRPRAALMATPGLWRGERLIAAPLAGWPQGWQIQMSGSRDTFLSSLLSH